MIKAISNFVNKKVVRFLICGGITAVFNVIVLAALIEYLNIKTPLWRNIANIVAMEISVLFSFWIYKLWVWTRSGWHWRRTLFRQLSIYHASISVVIGLRSFIIFPILDWVGVQYMANTLVGIAIGSVLNYFCSDKIVFKE